MENLKLRDISIGYADGLSESNDNRFLDMFYTGNNKYSELLEKNKFIISGRKGTGKTVLAQYYLKTEEKKDTLLVAKYIRLQEISKHELIEFGDKVITNRKITFQFQKYFVFKEIARMIVDNKRSLRDFKFNVLNFIRYLIRYRELKILYKSISTDEIFTNYDLEEISDNGVAVKFDSTSISSKKTSKVKKTKKEFYNLVDIFEDKLKKVIRYIPVLLIIDDFDDYFIDKKNDIIRFAIDFVKNISDINIMFQSINKECKCILLMRTDVIERFSSNDGNIGKVLSTCQVSLNWLDGNGKNELQNMICNKILKSNDSFSEFTIDDIKRKYFPRNLTRNKAKKSKRSKDFFDKVIEYGFGRPRDVVVMLNEIINNFPDESKFNNLLINQVSMGYSTHFLDELKNEMNFHIDDKNMIDELFGLLSDFHKTPFNYTEFNSYCISKDKKFEDKRTFDKYLNIMYKFGIIGYMIKDEKNTSMHFWAYRENASKNIDYNGLFHLHRGLQKSLNIK